MKKILILSMLFCGFVINLWSQNSLQRIEQSPYPYSSRPDKLYLTSDKYSYSELLALQSLQGVLAKLKPEILRDIYGHKELVSREGIPIDESYYNNFPGLLAHFSNRLDGYILCDAKANSTNVAISLSGILNAVVIPADIQQTAINANLNLLLDVRGKDEIWLFANYGTLFSKQIACYQYVSDNRGLFLGDYSAFTGAIQFWSDNPNSTLANNVYNHLNSKAALLGWGPGEDNTVASLSNKSLMIHPADFAPNLSTLTNIGVEPMKQKDPVRPFKVVPGVHTVCFVMSDGDNVQWLLGASDDSKTWANPNRAKLNLGWTISPALVELAPTMYKKYVDNMLTSSEGRNYLIAAPSGRGYFNPGIFPDLSGECDLLNKYMEKCDLRIANVIDVDNSPRNMEPYLRQSNIDAVFDYNYTDYSGLHGKISWYKDKPIIGGRYNLWLGTLGQSTDKTPQTLPLEINKASTDIYSADGYSLIPVIVWSNNVNDVLECIGNFGPNVRVVAPDEFVWLIRKNLKGLPLGIGNGLKGKYYDGANFETLKYTQTDRIIDFNWGDGSPNKAELGTDQFSVIWSGQLQPLYSQEYTFYVNSDDGVKLTIDGNVLLDSKLVNGPGSLSNTITLSAGQKYDITLEYVENDNDASCKLEWESTSQSRQVVPKLQLYSEVARPLPSVGAVTAYSDCDFGGFSGGLKVGDYNKNELTLIGILDNDIASLKVPEGFKVILYEGDDFEGESIELTTDNRCLDAWNDRTSSLQVKTNGATDLEGTYFLKNQRSNYYMDVTGGINGTGNGTNIQQWNITPNINQQFKLVHLGDGTYKIIAVHSKKAIEVKDSGLKDGDNVQQWAYYGLDNQQFVILPTTNNGHKLIAKHSGKTIESEGTYLEANVRQWKNNDQLGCKWQLIPVPELVNGNGSGLNAAYYSGTNFETLRKVTTDPNVNFNWGNDAPNQWVGADNFSVRWTGYIQPRFSSEYTFYITSDNGRRVWINGQLIIDKWLNDYDVEYSGNITLSANQKYEIKVEYFEANGGANCKFEWRCNQHPREVVPMSQLYLDDSNVSINTIDAKDVVIYPNPVNNQTIYISGLDTQKEVLVTVYDLLGIPLITKKISDGEPVCLDGISSGAYIVNLYSKEININKRILVL
jgi:hypothetical protein